MRSYAAFLDAEIHVMSDPDCVELVGHRGVHLAIRRDHGYAPSSWPRPENAHQAHLRMLVAYGDLDEAERKAVSLGAMSMDTKDSSGPRSARLYADPAGHSFSFAVFPRNEPTGPGREAP